MSESYKENLIERFGAENVNKILQIMSIKTLVLVIIITVIGAMIGSFLGKKNLKKHIEKAGLI